MAHGTLLKQCCLTRCLSCFIVAEDPHLIFLLANPTQFRLCPYLLNMGVTACSGKADSISMPHSSTNMKVWGVALSPWNTKFKWGLRNIPWAHGWSVGSRYSHNLPGLLFQESPADDKNEFFFSAICTGIHGMKYNRVLQWMLVHRDPKRAAIAPLTKGQSWTDFCVQLTLGTYPGPVWNKEATQNGFDPCGSPFHGNEEWHLLQQLWCNTNRQLSYDEKKSASPNATIWTLIEEKN